MLNHRKCLILFIFLLPTNKLYKKENTKRLKNFPARYVEGFYRNLAENVHNFIGSDFYSRITADVGIPREDVQKYILATSDFAKSIQTDINHHVTRDRINDANFRQKVDPISKSILRRQTPLKLLLKTKNLKSNKAKNLKSEKG